MGTIRWQHIGYDGGEDGDDPAAEYIDAMTGEAYYHRYGRNIANMPPVKKEPETTAVVIAPTPMAMIEKAITQGAGIETLERLMALQERWETTEARREYDDAMAKARAEIRPIIKTRPADFGTGKAAYKYEDLADIAEEIDPILAKYGLSYRWEPQVSENGAIIMTCIVSHARGHHERSSLPGRADASGNKNPMQAIGSAITYLQRYTLRSALGLAAARDDDGQTATPHLLTDAQYQRLFDLIKQADVSLERVLIRASLTLPQFNVLEQALNDRIEQMKAKNAVAKLKERREAEATLREQLKASVELEEAKKAETTDDPAFAEMADIPAAYEMGRHAWHRAAKRDQWPAGFRDKPELQDAWISGWDREEHAGGEVE